MNKWIALAGMGVLGTFIRAGLNMTFPWDKISFPWTTFSINLLGSFAIGLLSQLESIRSNPVLYQAIIVGLLGSFTTFSTFSLENLSLIQNGKFITAFTVSLGSVFFGVLLAYCGIIVAGYTLGTRLNSF